MESELPRKLVFLPRPLDLFLQYVSSNIYLGWEVGYLFGRGGEYLLMKIGDDRWSRREGELDLLIEQDVWGRRVDAK